MSSCSECPLSAYYHIYNRILPIIPSHSLKNLLEITNNFVKKYNNKNLESIFVKILINFCENLDEMDEIINEWNIRIRNINNFYDRLTILDNILDQKSKKYNDFVYVKPKNTPTKKCLPPCSYHCKYNSPCCPK